MPTRDQFLTTTGFNFSKTSQKKKRILLVDDEPYNLMALKVIINCVDNGKTLSMIIDQATNGLEAYKAVKQAHQSKTYEYGLIFMDCSMPILDGYESTDKIRVYLKKNFEP